MKCIQHENKEFSNQIKSMCTVILVTKPKRIIVKLYYIVGWVDVTWDAGGSNSYRMGAEGKYDLALAPSHDPDKLQKHLAAVKGAGAVGGVPAVGVVAKPKGVTAAEAAKSKVSFGHSYILQGLALI